MSRTAPAYASAPDVQRLLSFLPATLTATTKPATGAMLAFVQQASDELDAALSLADYTVPVATGATLAAPIVGGWTAIGAAGMVVDSLPQGSDTKHAHYGERFTAILGAIRSRETQLPDAGRDATRSSARSPGRSVGGVPSPIFTREGMDDR